MLVERPMRAWIGFMGALLPGLARGGGVARDAAEGWGGLWRAERLRELAAATAELAKALDRAAERRFRAGDVAEMERNLVAMEVARAQAAAAVADGEWARARVEL